MCTHVGVLFHNRSTDSAISTSSTMDRDEIELEENRVAYLPKCSKPTCFTISARRVKLLSHHQAGQATRFAPLDRDEEDFEEDSEADYGRHR